MIGRHHLIAGVCTGGALVASSLVYTFPSSIHSAIPIAGMFLGATIGSLFPDIDSKTSMISQKMRLTSVVMRRLFAHRGFLHSPLFIILSFLLCWWLFRRYDIMQYAYVFIGFIAGLFMHLVCDFCTKGGIPILYPYNRHKFSISNMKTGNKNEAYVLTAICMILFGMDIFLIVNHIYINQLIEVLS